MIRASRPQLRPIDWKAYLAAIVVLLLVGCGRPGDGSGSVTREARQPFSARVESADSAIVAWSGYRDGYVPGAQETFDIAITNEGQDTWPGRYCLLLLDSRLPQVTATLEERPFTLESGVGFSDTLVVDLPEGLDAGAYGLSLAVRRHGNPIVDVVSIKIGDTGEVRRPTTTRDTNACLEACQ
jgi:hypothetical protein